MNALPVRMPLGGLSHSRNMEVAFTDLNSHDLRALFQIDRQKLRDRLNLRWKLHRNPGAWDDPQPQSILIRRQDGECITQTRTIGHIAPDGKPGEFTITPTPAAIEGDPDYYLPRLGRFHA